MNELFVLFIFTHRKSGTKTRFKFDKNIHVLKTNPIEDDSDKVRTQAGLFVFEEKEVLFDHGLASTFNSSLGNQLSWRRSSYSP
jgi:hypothetical protein